MNVKRKDLSPEELAAWAELSGYDIDTVGRFAFGDTDTLWTATVGINWRRDDADFPPLTTVMVNAMTGTVVHSEDPIDQLLEAYEGDVEFRPRVELAIQALESGLARLREALNGAPEAT